MPYRLETLLKLHPVGMSPVSCTSLGLFGLGVVVSLVSWPPVSSFPCEFPGVCVYLGSLQRVAREEAVQEAGAAGLGCSGCAAEHLLLP